VTQLQTPLPTAVQTIQIFWHICYIRYDDNVSNILNINWYIARGFDEGRSLCKQTLSDLQILLRLHTIYILQEYQQTWSVRETLVTILTPTAEISVSFTFNCLHIN
jgi:hypothetical protein